MSNILIKLLGGLTQEQIEEVLDEEIKLTQETDYYKITNTEETRKDMIRKIRLIGWKIFTKFNKKFDENKYW